MILSGRIAGVAHVPESRFGQWFLATDTWAVHVLTRAISDLERLIEDRRESYPVRSMSAAASAARSGC